MSTKCPPINIRTLFIALGLVAWGAVTALGQDGIYAARVSSASTTVWDSPFYWIANGGSAFSTSTGKSAATNPVSTPSRVGCYFHTASTTTVGEGYGLVHTSGTQLGAIYEVDVTQPSSNVSTDMIMNVGSTNCDIGTNSSLPFTPSTPAPPASPNASVTGSTAAGGWTNTTAFASANSANKWAYVCLLTNRPGVTKPHIEFKYVSGVNTRLYADCIRFHQINQPCLTVPAVGVQGPISTNQSSVRVTGVTDASDLAVIVYQKVGTGTPTAIGTLTSGIVVGDNDVPVTWTASSKGAQIIATQIDPIGMESCQNFPGYVVGGGPNPRVRVFLNCKTSPGDLNAGPVGATGDTAGVPGLFFMPGVAGTVPNGGILLQPSTNWQTIVIDPRTVTKSSIWSGTGSGGAVGAGANVDLWATLEGIDFQLDDNTDTGPMDIKVDNIYSGPTLLTDFTTDWNGNANNYYDTSTGAVSQVFLHPAYTGFPVGQFEGPDSFLVVSNNFALSGTNVGEWKWQWSGPSTTLWVRNLMFNGANWNYPQIHMDKVFQFDILLLPKGATESRGVGTAPPLADMHACPGDPFTTAVTVTPPIDPTTGTPLARTYTYQWSRNGTSLGATATTSSYTKSPVDDADAGTYSVLIGDGSGNTLTRYGILTVPTAVKIDTQPANAGVVANGLVGEFHVVASIDPGCPCANTPPITYQWYFNGTPLSTGGNIAGATAPDLYINPATVANAGTYTVVVTNTCTLQHVTSSAATLLVTPHDAIPNACQTGLLGLYYTNQTLLSSFIGAPAWTNVDLSIDFNWSTNSLFDNAYPGGGGFLTATDNVTVRWVGTLQAPYDSGAGQSYTFYTHSDDGVRLWVDGQLVINKWQAQGPTTWTGSIVLTTNAPVQVILEYIEIGGGAVAQLSYSSPNCMPSNTIPATQLCAADPNTAIPPFVAMTAPANNTTNTLGPVTLTATVTPESATVNSVKFYNGASLLATVAYPTVSTTWTPPTVGVYNINAQVEYNTTNKLNSVATNKLTVIPVPAIAVTIGNISGTTLTFSGGGGTSFILLSNATVNAVMSTWTPVHTNGATPGTFTIPAVGTADEVFYRIQSK